MKQTVNEMAFYWTMCVLAVAILFGIRLWVIPMTQTMPYVMTALLVMAALFGSVAFLTILGTSTVLLFKKDKSPYKPIHGLKTWDLLSTGFLLLFFIFLELEGMSAKQKILEAARNVAPNASVGITSFSKATPVPSVAPIIAPDRPVAKLIDCTGPDKVVFKATAEECTKLNKAWGVTMSVYSPPPQVKVATPTSPCVLNFGTYNLTPTDCAHFKEQDRNLQTWQTSIKNLPSYEEIVNMNTTAVSDTGYTYTDYTQQNTQCKSDVQEWLRDQITSIEALGRANGSTSQTEYQISQAQSQASGELAECDQQYPVQ
jgi:hypothetical protein